MITYEGLYGIAYIIILYDIFLKSISILFIPVLYHGGLMSAARLTMWPAMRLTRLAMRVATWFAM